LNLLAYEGMVSTVTGSSSNSYATDFRSICGGRRIPGTTIKVPTGCSMLVYEVYGGDNRVVNSYLYQPSTAIAFQNTIYIPKTMAVITTTAPTALVETYYSCVLDVWNSIYAAIGLANSSVQFFVLVGFFLYFSSLLLYLNQYEKRGIESLKQKQRRLAKEAEIREAKLTRVAEVFDNMKLQFDALCEDMKKGDRSFSGFERAVIMAEDPAAGGEGIGEGYQRVAGDAGV
jgi:hypothetical protein